MSVTRTIVVGCNHRSAPIHVRERIAFSPEQCIRALRHLRAQYPDCHGVILSTCNRTELYVLRPLHGHPREEEALRFLAEFHTVSLPEVQRHSYHFGDGEAARHLFRVVSSLDSMLVGETEVLWQARRALALAQQAGAVGGHLTALFQKSFATAKEVRRATDISKGHVSIGSVAAGLARQVFPCLSDVSVLLIGTGRIGEQALRHILRSGPKACRIANRTFPRAERLAARLGGRAVRFENLAGHLAEADLIISSTGSSEPVVTADQFRSVSLARDYARQLIIDLAVPRDFEHEVSREPQVLLYNVDDLQSQADACLARRIAQVGRCNRIIDQRVCEFVQSRKLREVGRTITALQQRLDELSRSELDWLLPKLKNLSERDQARIEQVLHRLTRKFMHAPVSTLRARAAQGEPSTYAQTLGNLFHLDPVDREDA